jgi:hypothetical protein
MLYCKRNDTLITSTQLSYNSKFFCQANHWICFPKREFYIFNGWFKKKKKKQKKKKKERKKERKKVVKVVYKS